MGISIATLTGQTDEHQEASQPASANGEDRPNANGQPAAAHPDGQDKQGETKPTASADHSGDAAPSGNTPAPPPPAPPQDTPKTNNSRKGQLLKVSIGTVGALAIMVTVLVLVIDTLWPIVAGVVALLIVLRLVLPRLITSPPGRPVPTEGGPARLYKILHSRVLGFKFVPKINAAEQAALDEQRRKTEAEAANAAEAEAEQIEFDELGDEINRLVHELVMEKKSNIVVMAQNQAGTATKTWASTWLSSELAKTCHYDVAYVEVRDGSAFGTDILGVPRDKTVDTKTLLDHADDIGPSGNLDRYAHRSPYGVYGITTRSKQDGKPLSREEGKKSLRIVIDRATATFIDPGNTPVSEFNLAACLETDVHVLVCAPNLVAADNLALTIEELRQQGVKITPENAFAMFNGWRSETPEEWRDRLGLPEEFELLGTEYDPGADITTLSKGIDATYSRLRVHLKRVTLKTRIALRHALVKALRLRLAQLETKSAPSTSTDDNPPTANTATTTEGASS